MRDGHARHAKRGGVQVSVESTPGPRSRGPSLVVFLAAFLAHARSLFQGFIALDDPSTVTRNPAVLGGLTWDGVVWAFRSKLFEDNGTDYWQPLTHLSHMLDVSLFGLHPFGHHLVNVLLHAAACVVVFHFLRRATGEDGKSLVVALLLAVHPVHVESVAWVTERKDVLALFFTALSLLSFVEFVREGRGEWFRTTLLMYALSLMAKPLSLPLPGLFLILLWWPLGRFKPHFRKSMLLVGASLLLAVASALITMHGHAVAFHHDFPVTTGAKIPVAYAIYLRLLVLPVDLGIFYPLPVRGFPAALVTGSYLLLLAGFLAAFKARKKLPWLSMGWLWILMALSPVVALTYLIAADRFLYLASLGGYIAVVWSVAAAAEPLGERRALRIERLLAAITIPVLLLCAVRQHGFWRDTETLVRRALAVTDENYFAEHALSQILRQKGEHPEALRRLDYAMSLTPGAAPLHFQRGQMLLEMDRVDEAHGEFSRAVAIDSGIERTLRAFAEAAARAEPGNRLAEGYRRFFDRDSELFREKISGTAGRIGR